MGQNEQTHAMMMEIRRQKLAQQEAERVRIQNERIARQAQNRK